MTYLDPNFEADTAFDTDTEQACAVMRQEVEAAFTPREWLVIRLAGADAPAERAAQSRIVRFFETILDLRAPNPLADPRLEILRQAAARLWKRERSLDGDFAQRLRDHGFSVCQLSLLSSWIALQR